MKQTSARADGGAARHPWYDDRLGRTVRTGMTDVRNAQPSDDVWLRIAADLGIPPDSGLAVGLAAAPNGWFHRVERCRIELIRPLRGLTSIAAIALAVLVVGLSFDVVLSGHNGDPLTWSSGGLHQIGVPEDEVSIQPSPQNRAPADMSAARWWPEDKLAARRARDAARGSPLALAPAYASRLPVGFVVPR